jgi:hypothetical protein
MVILPGYAPSLAAIGLAHPIVRRALPTVRPRFAGRLASGYGEEVIPIGYVIGGILVIVGLVGGIYGQILRRRGRRPPR